jgi:hypothetical protein
MTQPLSERQCGMAMAVMVPILSRRHERQLNTGRARGAVRRNIAQNQCRTSPSAR